MGSSRLVSRILGSFASIALVFAILAGSAAVALADTPTDLSLAKEQNGAEVYWLQNYKKYHVLNSDVITMQAGLSGWSWSQLHVVPDGSLSSWTTGPDFVGTSSDSNNLLMRQVPSPRVYIMDNGKRRWITAEEFSSRGFRDADIIIVTATLLNSLPRTAKLEAASSSGGPYGTSVTVTQNSGTVYWKGSGFEPGTVTRHFILNGIDSPDTGIAANSDGVISWQWSPSCSTATGTYTAYVVDGLTTASNTVSQTVLQNSICVPVLQASTTSASGPWNTSVTVARNSGTVYWRGTNFTPNATITRHFVLNGSDTPDTAQVDGSGLITWQWQPSCSTLVGAYSVRATDPSRGDSNTVSQTVTTGNCSSPPPTPVISLNSSFLPNSCLPGSDAPSQSFEVWNSGSGTLSYSVSDDNVTWLSCNPASGTSTGEHDLITVVYSTSGLAAGSHHQATISVADSGATNSPQKISVDLTVVPLGSLEVTPADGLSASGMQGGTFTPASKAYTLSNNGGTPVNWTAAKSASWLTLSKASGTLAANGGTDWVTASINPNANSLTPPSYSDSVIFTNTSNHSGDTSRAVSLFVTPAAPANLPPVLDPIGNRSLPAGRTLSFKVRATDWDGSPGDITYSYDVSGTPLTMSCQGEDPCPGKNPCFRQDEQLSRGWPTYSFAWKTCPDQAGAYTVIFTATDKGSPPKSTSEPITITVLADSDQDSIPDEWEIHGIDMIGGTIQVCDDEHPDLDLPGMGADPLHKDIFVQVDMMVERNGPNSHIHKFTRNAMQLVMDAFDSAPVSNQDGTTGIRLHIDAGSGTVMNPVTRELWGTKSKSNWIEDKPICSLDEEDKPDWTEFLNIRDGFTDSEGTMHPPHRDPVRRPVFRYCIFAHSLGGPNGPCTTGMAITGGYGFIVSIDALNASEDCEQREVTDLMQAGTFMHELGHTLSLPGDNTYPNYLSVMNYSYQYSGLRKNGKDGYIDYSHFPSMVDLYEWNLNEQEGIYGENEVVDYEIKWNAKWHKINEPIDWNGNWTCPWWNPLCQPVTYFEESVSYDINGNETTTNPEKDVIRCYNNNWGDIFPLRAGTGGLGLRGEEEMPIASVAEPTMEELTALSGTPSYAVAVSGPSLSSLTAGSLSTYSMIVKNIGELADTFTLSGSSSRGWADTSNLPPEVHLESDEKITLEIPVAAPAAAGVGEEDLLTVRAVSQTSPNMLDTAEVVTEVVSNQLQASVTVKPLPLDLATTKKLFTCLIDLPAGYSEAQINQASLRLSLPSCPDCGADASPSGALQGGVYAAKFRRAFLRKVAPGDVSIKVMGQLQDGTPFEGTMTVQTWKPLTNLIVQTVNAQGQPETRFAPNEPIVLSCSYNIDPRADTTGLRTSLLVKAFGQSFASPWLSAAPGPNHVGYSLRVPADAPIGPQDLELTLRLKKGRRIYDKALTTMPVEVIEPPIIDWQP